MVLARHWKSIALVLAAHAALLAWLLAGRTPPSSPTAQESVLQVDMIAPTSSPSPTPPAPAQATPPPVQLAPQQPSPELVPPAKPVAQTPAPTSVSTSVPQAAAQTNDEPTAPAPATPPLPAAAVAAIPEAPQQQDTPPQEAAYANNPKPAYPALSRRLGESGTVILNILIEADGSIGDITVKTSSGYSRLDEAAKKTVRDLWKFKPAIRSGKAVDEWLLQPIKFDLNEAS